MKLRPKQKAFADSFAKTGLVRESALEAGYSEKTASEMGCENLKKPHIVDYIKELSKELDSEKIADMKEIKEFWTSIVRGGYNEEQTKDLLGNKIKASELIAKTNGAFLDKDRDTDKPIEIVIKSKGD